MQTGISPGQNFTIQERHPPVSYDYEGCIRLANAIVTLAAKDYRKALKALKKNPRNRLAMDKALECERFFDGDWIQVLTTIDGQWLKNRLREEVRGHDSKRVSE